MKNRSRKAKDKIRLFIIQIVHVCMPGIRNYRAYIKYPNKCVEKLSMIRFSKHGSGTTTAWKKLLHLSFEL